MGLLRKSPPDQDLGTGDLRVDTLAWINRQRRAYERDEIAEIPKGIPGTTLRCPVSVAFEDIFGVGLVITTAAYLRHTQEQEIITRLPMYVTLFVRKFDEREYPDLIIDADPQIAHFLYVPDGWAESYYTHGHCGSLGRHSS